MYYQEASEKQQKNAAEEILENSKIVRNEKYNEIV